LVCSLWATLFAVVLGVPLAWVLARVEFPGRAFVRALVLLPLVVPPVVGGVGLFYAFGRDGLVGRYLYDWFDVQLTFSTAGVVMAETFVAMPFLIITVEAALRSMDRRYEDAASTLGAGRMTVFRRVTVPLIAPGLLAGAALAWARALGEFGATITFAGNIQGRTQTTPLAVYLFLQTKPEVAIGLSIVLLAICVAVLALLRDRWLGVG
jgi:molybdate transport system permease protein